MDISYRFDSKVYRTICDHGLIINGDHVGIGVSGGKDSMALLESLLNMKKYFPDVRLSVLHFEHGLRGEESEKDMDFVVSYCRQKDIPCFYERADVSSYAEKNGLNLEDAARTLRYSFFERCSEKYHIDKIAVAHHMNDNAETFLFSLLRGAGTRGLKHMSYISGMIIRPLLDVTRTDIEMYIKANQIPFREDSTNADIRYSRNYIRQVIVPSLENINPNAVEQIAIASSILTEEHDYIRKQASALFDELASADEDRSIIFRLNDLFPLHSVLIKSLISMAAYRLVPELRDLTSDHLQTIAGFVKDRKANASYMLPYGLTAYTTYDLLIITSKMYKIDEVQPIAVSIPVTEGTGFILSITDADRPERFPAKDSCIQFIDGKKLPSDLVIRTRRDGDVFHPLSLGGTQKLKKWFIDHRISSAERDRQLLLCDGNEVLWIIGHAISDRLKIDDDTERVKKISFSWMSEGEL